MLSFIALSFRYSFYFFYSCGIILTTKLTFVYVLFIILQLYLNLAIKGTGIGSKFSGGKRETR